MCPGAWYRHVTLGQYQCVRAWYSHVTPAQYQRVLSTFLWYQTLAVLKCFQRLISKVRRGFHLRKARRLRPLALTW